MKHVIAGVGMAVLLLLAAAVRAEGEAPPASAEPEAAAVPGAQAPAAAATGTVYRTVDAKGNVTYTDYPLGDHSTPVQVMPPNTMPAVEPYQKPAAPDKPAAGGQYKAFQLTSPAQDAMLGFEVEAIVFTASIDPPLKEGHKVQFFLDGKAVAEPGTALTVETREMLRGTHKAEARLFNEKGGLILSSGVHEFHIKRSNVDDIRRQEENKPVNPYQVIQGAGGPRGARSTGGVDDPEGADSIGGARGPQGARSVGNPVRPPKPRQ